MRKAVMSFRWSSASEGTLALAVAAVFYAFGSILGGVFAVRLLQDGGTAFPLFLEKMLALVQTNELVRPDLVRTVLSSLRWLLAEFVLSLSVLGMFGIPVLCGVRGFLLSFSVWAFTSSLGKEGWILAILLAGISALLTVPVFLFAAVQGFLHARSLVLSGAGKAKSDVLCHRRYYLRWIGLACALCVGLIAEWYAVPTLLTGLSNILLD